jgi:hypothetical protein
MKKLFTLLFAAVMAFSLSFATFAEDKPAAEKPAAAEGKKKAKKKADKKKAEGEAAKEDAAKAKKCLLKASEVFTCQPSSCL